MRPTVLDLFSGIGGFTLAFEAAGCETIAFSEIEPYPCKILAQHFSHIPNLGDIRKINGANYPADIVCGGFPCQPHSLAGKRKAESDARDLYPEMARIISGAKPAFVLAENVPGLSDGFLDRICADLENLNYSILSIEVPAIAVGAPQISNRLWIMAKANSLNAEGVAVQSQYTQQICERGNQSLHEVWLQAPAAPSGMDHGIPNKLDRIKAVGNSIVPACAYIFAKWIADQIKAAGPRSGKDS